MDKKKFEDLGVVVTKWLDYQVECGRKCLLSEHYLAQPVGEFLLTHYSGTLNSEFTHPNFKNAKRGRPRQIDYALFTRDDKYLEYAVEVKWAGTSLPTRQNLVNDCMRLEQVRPVSLTDGIEKPGTVHRYFMLAGETSSIEKTLSMGLNGTGITPRPKFLERFLPLSKEGVTLDLAGINNAWREYFKSFSSSYSVQLPRKYKVKLIKDEIGGHARVLVWQIQSTSKRTEFDPNSESGWDSVTVNEKEDEGEA